MSGESDAFTREGEALTREILATIAPMMEGKPPKMIVQVMATLVLSTVLATGKDTASQQMLLARLSAVFQDLANARLVPST